MNQYFTQALPVAVEWMGVVAVTMLLALSPTFKRRLLIFKFPLREGLVALSCFLVLVLGLVLLYTQTQLIPTVIPGLAIDHLKSMELASGISSISASTPVNYTEDDLLRQLTISALSLAPFAIVLLVRRQPFLSVGLGRQTLRPSITLGVALGLMTIFLRGKVYNIVGGISQAQAVYLLAMLGVGLAEEVIFRGFIQLRLTSWLGPRWGLVSTAAAFALYHIPQRILVEHISLPGLALSLLFPLIFGLITGWIMQKSGNVVGLAIYHAIHNWMTILP